MSATPPAREAARPRDPAAGGGSRIEAFDYVIVGAGITGASAAARLSEDGASTLVLEAGAGPAPGATGSSGGMVRCYDPDPEVARLATRSMVEYARPEAWESGAAPLRRVGAVTLAAPEAADALQAAAKDLRGAGWPAYVVVDHDDVLGVRGTGAAALVEPEAGWVDPKEITALLLDRARAEGGEVRFDTRVSGLAPEAAGGVRVRTGGRSVHAIRGVVLAVGAWGARAAIDGAAASKVRTRSVQTALVRYPEGRPAPAGFIDLRTGGYGKPVDERTGLVGYPLLAWNVDPEPVAPPDPAHRERTIEVVAGNLPWIGECEPLGAVRGVDAFGEVCDALVPAGLAGVWYCRPGNGGGVRVAPALGREIAAALSARAAGPAPGPARAGGEN